MREMKDSGIEWIKQIPTGWTTTRGKNILQLMKRPPEADDEVITCFRNGEVTLRRNRREEGFTFSDKEIGYQGIKKGDLVIHGMDGFAGAIGISDSDGKGSPVLVVCTTKENARYLVYYLRTLAMQDVFLALATGIRERSCDLRWNKIADLLFPVPELDEQCRIADYLDRKCSQIDAIIARQQEVIEKLKAYKLSVITEAVTKGLNPDVPMKDSGIPWVGNICNHYALSRVGAFCFVTKLAGFEYTDIMSSAISDTGEVPIVRAQNVRMFNFNDNIDEYIGLDVSQKLHRCALNKKCLLITFIGAGIGDVCVFSKTMRYHLAPNVAKIEIRDEYKTILDEEYLMFYLGSLAGKGEISKISKASAQPSLSMGTIRGITIAVPPIDEQREISEYLSKKIAFIDKVVRDKESIIENLLAYKSSLIYEVVTGKKEV